MTDGSDSRPASNDDSDESDAQRDPEPAGAAVDGESTSDERRRPWVVDVDWLAAHATDDDVAVIDVRDAWEYDGIGHVPGAVNVPFESFRSDGDEDVGMLPGADAWAAVLRDAGVDPADTLVAYDDTHGVFAARFLVTARMYGHRDVALLDGDYSAYARHHPTSSEDPDVEPTEYPAPRPGDRPLVDADTVHSLLDDPTTGEGGDVVFVDTRDPDEYAAGHLPGAVNLDWKALVDDDTRGLLPEPDLRDALESHGVHPSAHVVLYCNTARRISHTYVALQHLDYDHVDFFEGSLTAWRARDGTLHTTD